MKNETIDTVLATGGWWWFDGRIAIDEDITIEGVEALCVPRPEDNMREHPIISFWGEWLDAESFDGEWIGPVDCPFEQKGRDNDS